MEERLQKTEFLEGTIERSLLVANLIMAVAYFVTITILFPIGNKYLFLLLIAGEVFHLWQILGFIHSVWNLESKADFDPFYLPPVDVFITVAGEPVDVVEATVRAAKQMEYPDFKVHILNDGLVANKENWREVEALARRLRVPCITRVIPGGAKAGNINNALDVTTNPYIAVFDADQVPHADFLRKTMGYFADPRMGFVQTPQYYKNQGENLITEGAWEQQSLFFGPISRGKNASNSVFMCGTNMVVSRRALEEVGGLLEDNITEDFGSSMHMQARGWRSYFVPEVLAEGLAPEDFLSYYKQQYRWAKGSLDMVLKHNPILKKGLSLGQRIQYAFSPSFYLSGLVVLMNAVLPLIFFFTGLMPLKISTMSLASVFIPYIFLTIYIIQASTNFTFSFRALSFSMASFPIYIGAFLSAITGKKSGFTVTSKKKLNGNFLHLVIPHILYMIAAALGLAVAIGREGFDAAVAANLAWTVFNVAVFVPFIMAALPQSRVAPIEIKETEPTEVRATI